jgi:hypothetical protein
MKGHGGPPKDDGITIVFGNNEVLEEEREGHKARRVMMMMMGGPLAESPVFGWNVENGRDGAPVSVSQLLSAGPAARIPQSIWVS